MRGSDLCAAHHPETQAARRAGSKRGGRGSGGASQEIVGLKRQLQEIADGTLDGSIIPARAAVATQALNALLRALETQRRWMELQQVEERLDVLERRLDPRRGRAS